MQSSCALSKTRAFTCPVAAQARDGTHYRIRPITPEDAAREREFITGLSVESRYRRFMYTLNEASATFIQRLVTIDRHFHMALVAVVGTGADERIIGVARDAADDGGIDCEFAVVVGDEWQGRGIGSTLAKLLFEYAATQGFRMIYGNIQVDNEQMLALARHLDLEVDKPLPRQEMVRAWRMLDGS